MGFSVEAVPPFLIGGRVVSSTAIRTALSTGDLDTATLFLGRRFSVTGAVTSTSRRGAALGFPMANLAVDPGRALPNDGVYVTIAHVSGKQYPSVTNIGRRPTFGETARVVETHILDFHGSLYGDTLTIEFATRLRDETPFPDREHLVAQIERDVAAARHILGAYE
jgi:riboflavin kinase/FMN adenylyltransferase